MTKYPFIFSDERKYRLQRHLAFWVFWWLFQGFLYAFAPFPTYYSYPERVPISLLDSLIYLPAHLFLAYSLMYFVIPRYLVREKYLAASAWVIVLFVLTSIISAALGKYIITPARDLFFPANLYLPRPNIEQAFYLSLLAGLRGAITVGGIAAAIKLMKYWYLKEQRNLQLQTENMEAQLQLLKAQVHPHFLFNTLNNIYSFTQTTSPVASRMVSRLSDLLRYILYEANQSLVPLDKELKLIRDYIALEKVRYSNKPELSVQLPEKTDGLSIAPLLLLPLVENCFKHGTSQVLEQPWISLQIDLTGALMQMKLLNGKISQGEATTGEPGIGIANVKKRLELLYPGRHELIITSEEHVFIVNLKLELERSCAEDQKLMAIPETSHA